MVGKFIFLLTIALASPFPKETLTKNENLEADQRPYFYLVDQAVNDQDPAQQTRKEEKVKPPLQPQQLYQPNGFGDIQYLEPQYQYPSYNQQAFPRIQPSFLLYGAGGQGQPILINPGSPPGNFLVPQQPGTNVYLRGNPQTPIFVGGYPNPKPAHIPPIEKDAEEIPTDPANIPPLPSSNRRDKKPEKLETFNDDKPEHQVKIDNESEILSEADKNPQPITRSNLRPGQRFFILNGEPLYQNYPPIYPEDPNLGYQQIDPPSQQQQNIQRQQDFNYYIPVQAFLLRNAPNFNQQPNFNAISAQNAEEPNQQNINRVPVQNGQRYTQSFIPFSPHREASLRGNLPGLIQLNGQNIPQEPLFRTNFQENEANRVPVGQFRFPPPNDAYFPFGDDSENDSVVVNANFDDSGAGQDLLNQQDISLPVTKSSDPSTAQAEPGAIALAGPGGVAGASPRATALAGNGGLAVSSPKATAIAGTKKAEKEDKEAKVKQENEKKPTRKPKN